ncbi:hypothetical protein A3E39_02085 [Candidatus Uhrbacteria bacterium RIFCSPHIGHO2_12_FULL_60_25]|uniref:Uncharacterized protein n=1 Tax=Candidatus Uhrbacteria bacterium RIFCSPHIGHO2_12_FULL_60_25 TaxID=1802399 RepID=A0A1F7ULK8_9BACT|nr:MAG: hypothetical protein A3D73_00635 [Candidatus Uhrbacteria bacterium RIFCSPHIGHO2_02_FULL_60_44]OGL78577.1 MAG: hypothetical protein A3E39_02085 [Candidatus Uhrbacteria bacterium RIFCSPHIGHO2_12_FULL_60_25]
MHSPRCIATVIACVTVAVPITAFAATTQQILNQAFKQSMDYVPLWTAGEVTLNFSDKALVKDRPSTYGTIKLGLTQRTQSRDKENPLMEGRLVLKQFELHSSSEEAELPFSIDGGLAIQWKMVGEKAYFRIEAMPERILVYLTLAGMNPSALIGQWVELKGREGVKDLAGTLSPVTSLSVGSADRLTDEKLKQLMKMQIFLVQRIEKRETMDGGATLRVRVRLNPRVVTEIYNTELRAIAKTDPLRREKIQTLNKQFAKFRKVLAGMQFVAVLDEQAQTLKRFEFGGRYSAPNQTCTTNYTTNRRTCRNTSTTTVTYTGGMSLAHDTGSVIEAPANAITLEQLGELLSPPQATSTIDMPSDSTTGTIQL